MSDTFDGGLPDADRLKAILISLGYKGNVWIPLERLPPERQRTALAAVAVMALVARLNNHTLTEDVLSGADRLRMHTAAAHHVIAEDDVPGLLSIAVMMLSWGRDITTIVTSGADDDVSPGPTLTSLLAAVLELVMMYYNAFSDPDGIVLDGRLYATGDPDLYRRVVGHIMDANERVLALGAAARREE